jgi:SET domain-containing protein
MDVRAKLDGIATWGAGIAFKNHASLTKGKCVQLRPSKIHNYGVWASDRFKKGAKILEYEGEIIDPREADAREKIYENATMCSYFFTLETNKRIIDATLHRNLARYINGATRDDENAYAGV